MLKHILHLCLFMALSIAAYPSKNTVEEQIERLENELVLRPHYDELKRHRIDSLLVKSYTSSEPYIEYRYLYDEYKSYNYDTALIYAIKMHEQARRFNKTEWISESLISQAFVYLSGGLFHETYTILSSLESQIKTLSDEYLHTYARLLYDMCDYASGTPVSIRYNEQGNVYMSLYAERMVRVDSAQYWYALAVVDLRNGEYDRSLHRMKLALKDTREPHKRAIFTSTMAFLYRQLGSDDEALSSYIDAAIGDIQSSTYETVAMRMVAEMVYERGEIEMANRYIHLAMEDAKRYNARHRQVSISQLLPIIEDVYIDRAQRQANTAYILFAGVFILFLIGIIGILLVLRRNKVIHEAQRTIDAMNENLSIANQVKEQLLGTLVTGHSQYLSAVEKYQSAIKESVVNHRYNELMTIPKNVDARYQRQVLNRNMDKMLLSIFPHFVEQFNALLLPENRIETKPDEMLTPALRIFALIRLGVVHNETIAEILDYSVNTVYNYKTRTMNLSSLSPDEFYDQLMQIN